MDFDETDSSLTDPWDVARSQVKLLGDLSASFTSCVRALLTSAGDNLSERGAKLSPAGRSMTKQLLRSPSVLAHLYFAAETFYPDKVALYEKIAPADFLEIFSLYELASILSVMYLRRRMAARVAPAEWNPLNEQLQNYVDIGFPLGQVIPTVGSSRGLLVGALRFLAWGALLNVDPKGMKKYRIALKTSKKFFNLDQEQGVFGTTHAHLGATLLTTFGFSANVANGFFQGMTLPLERLNDEERRYRVAQIWLDSLVQLNVAPEIELGDDYFLAESKEEWFLKHVENVLNSGSPHSWLTKTREDLSPESSPKLDVNYEKLKRAHQKPAHMGGGQEPEELEEDE